MSAAYRPYKDEDSCDNLNSLEDEGLTWPDHEPSSLQIYERTTEDLHFPTKRRYLFTCLGCLAFSFLIGFLLGFFGHSSHDDCVPNLAVSLAAVRHEDFSIRDKLMNAVDSGKIEEVVAEFSSEPRVPGSSRDLFLIEKIIRHFKDSSFDQIKVENYTVPLSLPVNSDPNFVEVVDRDESKIFSSLDETKMANFSVPPFSAYSRSDKKRDLIFVNTGSQSDYDLLATKYQTNCSGRIVLVKLGNLTLDLIVWQAHLHNASGVIYYPDSKFFGSQNSQASSFKFPGDAIKWESALWNEGGDPSTPDHPSNHYARRLRPEEVSYLLPQMPIHPISNDFASKLLNQLGGKPLPDEWKQGFNHSHLIGPGFKDPSHKMKIQVNNKLQDVVVRNVFGYIKGKVEPDRYVLVGNHRDSFTPGALDAASGTGVFLEAARVFGTLLTKGWRPRRTIVFCSWGGEELNLIGSTEWLEEKYKLIHSRAIVYINMDVAVSGTDTLNVFASPLLHHAIFNVTRAVKNPDDKDVQLNTVFEKWAAITNPRNLSSVRLQKTSSVVKDSNSTHVQSYLDQLLAVGQPKIMPLDTRSVSSLFVSYVGVPAMDFSYAHSPQSNNPISSSKARSSFISYGLTHTQYDNFSNLKLIDPDFKYHRTVAQLLIESLRDFSESLFIPFNLLHYAEYIHNFSQRINSITEQIFGRNTRTGTELLNSAVHNFSVAAYYFHTRQGSIDFTDPMAIRRVNDKLVLLERLFLDYERGGLSKRLHFVLPNQDPMPLGSDMSRYVGLIAEDLAKNFSQQEELRNAVKDNLSGLVHAIQSASNILSDSEW
ncbi:N-acetylated-alpha-linked acidic dipeptidase 2-like isoform X2 [Brevipalpus obovatus]|uniref:N-acetylated-alpha-linked acidic dipeptidase 2-like isoform X2 n=1 Tax=Brevipalpus obovatus TaxID=246614 RepID=UPI003D9EA18A